MIIEAGYDVLLLMHSEVTRDDESKRALWVLCLDERLRMLQLSKACDVMGNDIEAHVDGIAEALKYEFYPTKFYALAHSVSNDVGDPDEWLHDVDERLRLMPALSDSYLLGRLAVCDDGGLYSSVPRYSFRDYPLLEHLPRPAFFGGPHPMFGCTCPACEQNERMLNEMRERHRESAETSGI